VCVCVCVYVCMCVCVCVCRLTKYLPRESEYVCVIITFNMMIFDAVDGSMFALQFQFQFHSTENSPCL